VGNKFINSILFAVLCFIWGSSFILMKLGMFDQNQQVALSPYHVAALRMFSSGFVMLPFLFNALKSLPKATIKYILLSGWVGSFIPAFLFCIAETKIDGAVAGSLNSLTPLFVIVTGIIFFKIDTTKQKTIGVVVGLSGCVLLTLAKADEIKSFGDIGYSGFIILATVLYGINVNMVYKKLSGVSSMQIATVAFTGLIIPALIVLWITGYFQLPLSDKKYLISSVAGSVLGIVNTTVASVLFYMLIKRAGGLLASLVTYGVPLVAIGWGIYYGEKINLLQVISLLIILSGVYIAYRQKKS
jgi:drug/metabolite transporter (DMT)-like permease